MSTQIAVLPELLNEFEAAELLGISVSPIRRMHAEGALDGVPRCLGKKPNPHFRRADLLAVKFCLETARQLKEQGHADPVDGHLWVLKEKFPLAPGDKAGYTVTDLCANGDCGTVYQLKKAAEKCKRPWTMLKRAQLKWEKNEAGKGHPDEPLYDGPLLPGFRIYGGSWRLAFEKDLLEFQKATTAARGVDREKFKGAGELAVLVGAAGKSEMIEAAECAGIWHNRGWLLGQTIICERAGAVAKSWTGKHKRDDDDRNAERTGPVRVTDGKVSTKKICRQCLYDVARFKVLWKKDLAADIKATKQLIGEEGISAKTLRAELEKRGIVGIRFKRVVRLAGANKKWRYFGKRRECYYVVTHIGPRPVCKYNSLASVTSWLSTKLRSGPALSADLIKQARQKGINRRAIELAATELRCKRFSVYGDPPGNRHTGFPAGHVGLWGFLHLPKHERLADDEARRMIAEYRLPCLASPKWKHRRRTEPTTPLRRRSPKRQRHRQRMIRRLRNQCNPKPLANAAAI